MSQGITESVVEDAALDWLRGLGYQFMFWLIVLAYQLAALDSFQGWRYTRADLNYLKRTQHHVLAA